jgi:hypothetical protein
MLRSICRSLSNGVYNPPPGQLIDSFSLDVSIPKAKLYIDGEFRDSKTDQWIELRNPATQKLLQYVPQAYIKSLNI